MKDFSWARKSEDIEDRRGEKFEGKPQPGIDGTFEYDPNEPIPAATLLSNALGAGDLDKAALDKLIADLDKLRTKR